MKINENEKKLRAKLYAVAAVAFVALYSLYCFVIAPSYYAALYNIAYEDTVVPDLLHYLGGIVEMLALSVFFAVMSYCIYRLGHVKSRGMIALYIGANLYKYTCNVIMTWVDGGSIPREWYMDILNAVFYTVTELISFAIVWFILKGFIKAYHERQTILVKAGKSERVFPFVGIYKKKNCLMNSALWSSISVFALKLAGQLLNDLVTVKEILNVPLMLLSYGSNIIFAVLCYFAMILALISLDEKLGKIK